MNNKEIIGVDLLKLKSASKPVIKTPPVRIHRLAMQVNDMILEYARIQALNATLVQEIKKLRENV